MTFSEFWQSLYDSIFTSSGTTGTTNNSTKKNRSSPARIDLTFPKTINTVLTRGLWHNEIVGYKLGAGLCYNPIKIPLAFMGVPHFDVIEQNETNALNFWLERIKYYNENYIKEKQNIQLLCHRDGTAIIMPWFDKSKGFVRWRHIKPESIYKILVDPTTEDLTAIITRDIIYYYKNNGASSNYSEQTTYTATKIITKRTGQVPDGLNSNEVRRNPVQMLPIFFANDREPQEIEGHSDYERILSYVKAYSEINKSAHEALLNMGAKLVQKTDDVDGWLKNNAFTDVDSVDVSTVDFIINKGDVEESKFEVANGVIDGHLRLMELDFINIVEASGIPEIVWGIKMQGNHASAKEQMGVLLSFVDDKQRQSNTPYTQLMRATLLLEGIANNQTIPKDIIITWNDLDSLNEVEKSTIFKNWADGLSKLLETNALDLESSHKLLYQLTNGQITADFDEFEDGVKKYGTLAAYLNQDYSMIRETNTE